jgi:peptidyl-prolyl cis-trans isomerase B (cyclophilin B)
VPGKDRQRALARAKLERQMARRAAAARRRRQVQAGIGAAVAVVVVLAGVFFLVTQLKDSSGKDKTAAAGSTPAAAGDCAYPKSPQPASKDVGVPTVDDVPKTGTQAVTMKTNVGAITADLDLAGAPCTSHSFAHLAAKKYFDGTSCHRLVTANIFVLQCGDPSGSGSGGPGYQFADENLPTGKKPTYPAGTLAMANAGADTNGSQFFIVYKDTELPAAYTVFGKVTSGLDAVQKVAAKGVQGGQTDGKPTQAVTLAQVTVAPPGQ